MKEFFGFGGYQRPAEGAYSWQHLTFVTGLLLIMTVLAVFLGRKNRQIYRKTQNRKRASLTAQLYVIKP
jgi:hypothetical protein